MAEDLLAALSELYLTLDKMGDVKTEGRIKTVFAPPEGHTLPDGLGEELGARKTPEVVSLIKRLPYSWYRHLAPASIAINYSDAKNPWYHPHLAWRPVVFDEDPPMVLPSELPLTMAEDDGVGYIVVVDTETWEARSYRSLNGTRGYVVHQQNGEACEYLCRGRRDVVVKPAAEIIQGWTQKFLELEWTVRGDPDIVVEEEWNRRGEVSDSFPKAVLLPMRDDF